MGISKLFEIIVSVGKFTMTLNISKMIEDRKLAIRVRDSFWNTDHLGTDTTFLYKDVLSELMPIAPKAFDMWKRNHVFKEAGAYIDFDAKQLIPVPKKDCSRNGVMFYKIDSGSNTIHTHRKCINDYVPSPEDILLALCHGASQFIACEKGIVAIVPTQFIYIDFNVEQLQQQLIQNYMETMEELGVALLRFHWSELNVG